MAYRTLFSMLFILFISCNPKKKESIENYPKIPLELGSEIVVDTSNNRAVFEKVINEMKR